MLKLPLTTKRVLDRFEAVQSNGDRLMLLTEKEAVQVVESINSHEALTARVKALEAALPILLEELEITLKALDQFKLACKFQQNTIVPLWVNDRIDSITILIAKAKGES